MVRMVWPSATIAFFLPRRARRRWHWAAKSVPPAFHMTWHILALTGGAVLLIVFLASLVSIRRVLVLEPAIVFKT